MTQEEKKQLEDAAKVARESADKAHEAAANATDEEADALQQAADTAEAEAQAAQQAFDAAVVTPEGEEDEEDENIDFEKELAAIENGGTPPAPPATPPGKPRSELEKAERALHFNAKRLKELGGDPTKILGIPPTPPPSETPPAGSPSFATKEDLAEQEAAKYARTDAERKVIMHRYRTGIIKTGNVVEDVQNAYLLAHKGRIVRSFEEIRRGAVVRPMTPTLPGRKPPASANKAPELSKADQSIMRSRGFKQNPDGTWESKRYKMSYDTNTKAFVTVKKTK